MLIEQAIFTSAQTARADGYQLVAHSSGLTRDEVLALGVWGPSHDSLLEHSGQPSSTNFFRLECGKFCVSRTSLAGAEYSGRGKTVYTQFLVIPPEVLACFANNPFAVLRAATAIGAMQVHGLVPESLEPLRLNGRAAAVDLALLAQLVRDPGPAAMALLVQSALGAERLALGTDSPIERLVAGLFSLLPVECRTEFSFSTALKHSSSRPLRILSLPADRSTWRGFERQGFMLLDLDEAKRSGQACHEGWAGYVAQILGSGKLSALAAELDTPRPGLDCGSLVALSQQLQAGEPRGARENFAQGAKGPRPAAPKSPAEVESPLATEVAAATGTNGVVEPRADAAHLRRNQILAAAKNHVAKSGIDELVASLAAQPPEVLELLERVDDLVFTAIGGNDRAMAELQVLWPTIASELDANLVEQSREQYLRCALSIWTDCIDGEVRRPERAVAAIDVLCVLFEE